MAIFVIIMTIFGNTMLRREEPCHVKDILRKEMY